MNFESFNNCNSSSGSNNNILGRWTLLKQLGSGATSQVFLAVDLATNQRVAVKIFTGRLSHSLELLRNEASVLKSLSHSNILQLIETHESVEFRNPATGEIVTVCALVMEFAAGGEFFEMLEITGNLSDNKARHYFQQLIGAISHMHENGIAHRDIKLENILLDERENIKLADFGYSSKMNANQLFKSPVGTSAYFAPEIHAGLPHTGENADLFAAGIILFTMVTGHMPFSAANSSDRVYSLFLKGNQKTFWAFHQKMMSKKVGEFAFNSDFKDLINQIFEADSNKRITLQEVLCHPWMQGMSTRQ